ncbi:M24 family metallopeptidase [Radiobacillus deserti]|uniref:M24 family metallopeptidase n=1 Tax=Radiobacillus deserti TaxID=2594883 RepID=A0A516KKE6_9BACI|nr:M24 family metallopeptidase [Radiobacillus deserti]QDP41857.1 M24 family metallopeptidase [Radiobacillus deserti]
MLPFDILEYQDRIKQTKQKMAERSIDVLLITDPANMYYLSGYDAWSFYVHQMLVLIIDESQPLWIGRYMDANGARATTWIYDENVIAYPDEYVHSSTHHPMQFMAEILEQIGQGNRRIGVEMDHYYFTAKAYQTLVSCLPNATFVSGDLLVNQVRMIKSDQEIEYMRGAAKIAENAMLHGVNSIFRGVRECDVAAQISYHSIAGTDQYGGDYPSIVPMLPSGERTGMPHLTWSERAFMEGDSIIIELAGCYKRYHVPLARTVNIGPASEKLDRIAPIVIEGIEKVLDAVKPGITCSEIEEIWRNSIKKYGFEKEARLGYSVGLNYPPDWGEHTASIRRDDHTVLLPNMTFHFIPALWFDHYGIEISETIRVTDTGCETFTDFPRELIIRDGYATPSQDGKIS